ncbi:hypothetical protein GMJLKIPL_1923 [Methylobacterium isbiliense]|uniref:Uncharacterized protein n=1 Tax=Methylobacterium isbiliense TaxID=315478 RepID=A0ABQ4SE97_9HYPH|nr:hypothetical protein GMJLKIPL_1923 [Methylobacterium isbiliense]
MPYVVNWTSPSGPGSEPHDLGLRAAERAMTFVSMGASNVHVVCEDGRVFQAPSEMSALVQHSGSIDANRT